MPDNIKHNKDFTLSSLTQPVSSVVTGESVLLNDHTVIRFQKAGSYSLIKVRKVKSECTPWLIRTLITSRPDQLHLCLSEGRDSLSVVCQAPTTMVFATGPVGQVVKNLPALINISLLKLNSPVFTAQLF